MVENIWEKFDSASDPDMEPGRGVVCVCVETECSLAAAAAAAVVVAVDAAAVVDEPGPFLKCGAGCKG